MSGSGRLIGASLLIGLVGRSVPAGEFRTLDGTGNNPSSFRMGSQGETLARLTAPRYSDGIGAVHPALPNPRDVSNAVFAQNGPIPDRRGLSEWVWVWGQFLSHDMSHSLMSHDAGVLQIPIPEADPVFGNLPPGSAIHLTRSLLVPGTGEGGVPREHPNNISAWLDGGLIYGGRATDGPAGVDRATWLRDPDHPARLRVTPHPDFGDLLPRYEHNVSPVMANTHTPGMTHLAQGDLAYVAGDVRANENTSLLALHTVYVREHNRLVDILADASPLWEADVLYETARKIVGAQIQVITYNEYLPALGVRLSPYLGYNPAAAGSILTEFSTAAFRIGHSQINSVQLRLDEFGSVIPEGNLPLEASFFNPSTLLDGGLEPLLRGLAVQVQEATNAQMVDTLRNQLFQRFVRGVGLVDGATDLAAVDILRGRDMGLGGFNDVRAALGLDVASSFEQITSDTALAATLGGLYAHVNDLDLWVGLLVEDHLPGASLGPTTERLYALQFESLRDADRFWYQDDLAGINSDLLIPADWDGNGVRTAYDWLNNVTLADILRLNTEVGHLQSDVFFARPIPEPSSLLLLAFAVVVGGLGRGHRRAVAVQGR